MLLQAVPPSARSHLAARRAPPTAPMPKTPARSQPAAATASAWAGRRRRPWPCPAFRMRKPRLTRRGRSQAQPMRPSALRPSSPMPRSPRHSQLPSGARAMPTSRRRPYATSQAQSPQRSRPPRPKATSDAAARHRAIPTSARAASRCPPKPASTDRAPARLFRDVAPA